MNCGCAGWQYFWVIWWVGIHVAESLIDDVTSLLNKSLYSICLWPELFLVWKYYSFTIKNIRILNYISTLESMKNNHKNSNFWKLYICYLIISNRNCGSKHIFETWLKKVWIVRYQHILLKSYQHNRHFWHVNDISPTFPTKFFGLTFFHIFLFGIFHRLCLFMSNIWLSSANISASKIT